MGMFSQLFNQALLKTSQTLLLLWWRRKRLDVRHKQVLPERQPKDVQVFSTISEGTGESHKD